MAKIKFKSKQHEQFYHAMLEKSGNTDSYHRAFFYVIGIAEESRANINQMFDFKQDRINPEGMYGGWQTSGTVHVCHLAFNLWNGYTEKNHKDDFTPYDLFCCEFAPCFMEGIKLKYPEYCREIFDIKPGWRQ